MLVGPITTESGGLVGDTSTLLRELSIAEFAPHESLMPQWTPRSLLLAVGIV